MKVSMNQPNIPEDRRQLIDEAICSSFKGASWTLETPLSRGLSVSTLYQINVEGHRLVARLSDPNHPHNNLPREYDALQKAAEHNIAPKTYYADAHAGIMLMDFIQAKAPYSVSLSEPTQMDGFAAFIRSLHQCPDFHKDGTMFRKVAGVFRLLPAKFQASDYVTNALALKDRLEPRLSDPIDMRPSHCDIHPFNLLQDEKQFWLIDWEAASQQSFYFDLACCSNFFFIANPEAALLLLDTYLERPALEQEKHKYRLMQTFTSIYYGFMFIYVSTLRGADLFSEEVISSLPDYPSFMSLIGQGKEDFEQPLSQQKLGFIYLKKALAEGLSIA